MTGQISLRRLGETEYALLDPRYTRELHFGTLYSHPDFPDRYDANQLCRVRCSATETQAMLDELNWELAPAGLSYRKVSGYDPDVWGHLEPALGGAGWSIWTTSMMLFRKAPSRGPNPAVAIRSVTPWSEDLEALYDTDGGLDRGFELVRSQADRVGGEYLVGYVESEPACCTGWYVVDGVARFRHVYTAPWARGQGCATSLILHVQDHPEVRAQDGLVIMVTPKGPESLYRELGFQPVGTFWEAKIPLAESP